MEERMGRKGTGVEIRGKAIRIRFSLNGEVVRRTLRRDGIAIPPSLENLDEAKRLTAEIRSRIADGTFCHSEYFPATRKDGRPLTVGEHLDAWRAVQRIEPSTAAAYASAGSSVNRPSWRARKMIAALDTPPSGQLALSLPSRCRGPVSETLIRF